LSDDGTEKQAVAIVGMACLFPGAPDVDAFWRNIVEGVDATSDPPPEAWDPDVYYDPEFADKDRTYCKRGGYLGALARFDPLRHGIPPVAVGGEPDQWLALQIARDALADAGMEELPDEIRARTEIVLGKGTYLNGGNAVAVQRGLVIGQTIELLRRLEPERPEQELELLREELQRQLPPLGPETVPGLIPNIIVGRIANRLDLMGPAYTVDAACASSLVAVQHAVRDLRAGDCDLALAGGSQVWMPVATLNLFCRLGALSRREQLRAFDSEADGTLLSEGIGAVVLKRAEDAVRDGDRVYALIRGVGVASDGRGMSVMAPRIEGEELALRRAYAAAGVAPKTVGLIEAHGTGTPVGDAVEVQALTRVFGERDGMLPPTALGTVKSMIGHTIPAAGVAGLIKAALSLHHRLLPPTLNCEQPNPELGLERSPFYINTQTRPWIHGGAEPRRAGINAFGFGGINAHAVLEEWAEPTRVDHAPPWDSEVYILEAASQAELAAAAEELLDALARGPAPRPADLAFTLAGEIGDASSPRRLALVASSLEDLQGKLRQAAEKLREPTCARIKTTSGIYYEAEPLGPGGKTVFVFPGEGAQYPGMLAELCSSFDEAREAFDRIDRLYHDHPRGHLLSDWVFPRPAFSEQEREQTSARLMELDIAVEAVLTANAALHAVVRRLVPSCDAIVGHSSGEHSAAMAVGALDLDSDERLAAFCHGLYASYAEAAGRHEVPAAVLLALGTDAQTARRVAEEAGGELYLAMDNCPHQTVLVGAADAAQRAKEIALGEGIMCEQLPYDRAVHTPLFAPFAEDLRATFAGLPVRRPDRDAPELWSCTTAAPYPQEAEEIRELLVEHWTRPVRFRETVEALYEDGARVFVEVGPRGNMTSFVEDILRGRPVCAVAGDTPRRAGTTQLNHLVARLAVHAVKLDLDYLFARRDVRRIDWRSAVSEEAGAKTHAIALSTTWPMLKLDDEALERLEQAGFHPGRRSPEEPASNGTSEMYANGSPASGSPPNGSDVSVSPANGSYANGSGAAAPAPQHATPILPPPSPQRAAPAPIAASVAAYAPAPPVQPQVAAIGEDTAAVIEQHMTTMESFLTAGEEIVRAYLETATPAPMAPLLGQVVELQPESELIAERLIDLDEDLYLLDHTLGRTVSRAEPGLHGLALVPLAMSIEILSEAAACLLPGRVVTGMRRLRAHRWLDVSAEPVRVRLHARRLPSEQTDRVHVELRRMDGDGDGEPIVEATVLLAADYTVSPAARDLCLEQARPSQLSDEALYETMFHGPLWQGVRSIETVARDGVRAQLEVLPRSGLLRSTEEPVFALDPVLLDAAGQVIGLWAAEMLDRARVVFPFRLAELDLYGPPPPPGQRLRCDAAVHLQGEQLVSSDIDVLDGTGRLLMRLTGWEDKRFAVPDRLAPLARPAALTPMSTPWPEALERYAGLRVACRRLLGELPSDGALWEPAWASRVLGREERVLFAALSMPERRRLEWLAARTAAKECVAQLAADAYDLALLPAEIQILPDQLGAPVVLAPALAGMPEQPVVSLTHSHGEAAALAMLAAPGTVAVGLDVERLVPRPEGFATAALGEQERVLLEGLPAEAAEEWLLRLWCAREAAGKALGTGLGTGATAPRASALDASSGAVQVELGGVSVVVWTRREQDLVMASALHPLGGAGAETNGET
jgi:acyl transferase domain-containing protein/phosphopantetheinyl transferase (holo-ACP synthase)